MKTRKDRKPLTQIPVNFWLLHLIHLDTMRRRPGMDTVCYGGRPHVAVRQNQQFEEGFGYTARETDAKPWNLAGLKWVSLVRQGSLEA